jgi:outer membrane protein assembly factor BamB
MRRLSVYICSVLILCFISFSSFAVSATGPNWPQWRGPESRGISTEKNLPAEWSNAKNIKWKAPVPGRGHSSPIVWGNYVFLTTAIEGDVIPDAKPPVRKEDYGEAGKHPDGVGADRKHTLKVLCYDRNTGKLLWERTAYEGAVFDYRHRKNTYASGTPATDGKYVFAFFSSEGLYAFDFKGNLVWKADVGKLGTASVGSGTSPIVFGNHVIVQCDEDLQKGKGSFIAAFDKKTGNQVWRAAREVNVTWSVPIVVQAKTRAELITSATETIISYDPQTGKELWRAKGLDSNAVPSPITNGEIVVVVSGFPTKITKAIKPGSNGEVKDSDLAWTYNKGSAYVPSPILYENYVYLMTDRGILTCLDAKTGEVKYEGGRIPIPATFTASPVAFDGKILLTSEDGDTYIIKAGPKHELLATNSVDEPVYASPAISSGMIFIRGEKNLYCISNTK